MARRYSYADIANMSDSDINSMSVPEMRSFLKQARSKLESRQRQFERRGGKYAESYSINKFLETEPNNTNPDQMNRYQLRNEVARFVDTFSAKSFDIKGAREINLDQDRRIFGIKQSGRPKYRMTNEQRKKFWTLYDEFIAQNPTKGLDSNRIQQVLAERVEKDKSLELNPTTLQEMLDKMEARVRSVSDEEIEYGNVFTGRWSNN